MDASLSNCWTVEYQFRCDSFYVRPLRQYFADTQRAFHAADYFDSVLLAIHPTENGADEECDAWKTRRDQSPLTYRYRADQMRAYLAGLDSLAASEGSGS